MSLRLQCEWPLLRFNRCTGKRALNIKRSRIVTLDQIGIVAVHHADEVSEFGQTILVQALTDIGRSPLNFYREICQHPRDVFLEQAWFDTGGGFKGFHADTLGRFTY